MTLSQARSQPDATATEKQDFVIVRLDGEYLAFSVNDVAEVLPYVAPVRLPRAPKFLAGLIDVRGVMLPVVDLRLRAGLSAENPPRHILPIRLSDRFIGALVDEVCEVYGAEEGEVCNITALADRIDSACVTRALRWGQRLVPVMDAMRLLTTDETLRLKRLRHPRRRKGESSCSP